LSFGDVQEYPVVYIADDGSEEDVRIGAMMDENGWRMTFAIHPDESVFARHVKEPSQLRRDLYRRHHIANHSATHYDFRLLSNMTAREADAVVRREVCDARKSLEDQYGKPVPDLVLPWGRYDAKAIEILSRPEYDLRSIRGVELRQGSEVVTPDPINVRGGKPYFYFPNCDFRDSQYWTYMSHAVGGFVAYSHTWEMSPSDWSVLKVSLERHKSNRNRVMTLDDYINLRLQWAAEDDAKPAAY